MTTSGRMHLRSLLAILLCAVMVFTMSPTPAEANPRDQKARVDERVDQLKRDFAHLDEDLARAIAERDAAQEALPGAQDALDSAEDELAAAQAKDEELASRLTSAENAQADLESEVETGQGEIEQNRKAMTRLGRQAYQNSGVTSEMAALLSTLSSGAGGGSGVARVDAAVRSQQRALSRLDDQRSVNRNNEARLTAIADEITSLKDQAAEVVATKSAAEQAAADRAAELEDLVSTSERASQEIEASRESTQQELDEQSAEQERLAEEVEELIRREEEEARRRGESTDRGGGNGRFAHPAPGFRISSPFGYRIHPITGSRRLHTGMDYAVPCGTPIRAAAGGRVVSAGWAGGYGNRVVVSHGRVDGNTIATTYSHNTRVSVRAGQNVSQGDVIAISGTTGASTGCHLHFEVMRNGTYVNPAPFV